MKLLILRHRRLHRSPPLLVKMTIAPKSMDYLLFAQQCPLPVQTTNSFLHSPWLLPFGCTPWRGVIVIAYFVRRYAWHGHGQLMPANDIDHTVLYHLTCKLGETNRSWCVSLFNNVSIAIWHLRPLHPIQKWKLRNMKNKLGLS